MDHTFIFKNSVLDLSKGEGQFFYSLQTQDKAYEFVETLSFPATTAVVPPSLLVAIQRDLHIILGISYWKTFCPKKIQLQGFTLTKEQAVFWETVYTKGLGEFFYKNNIDYRGLVAFPFDEAKQSSAVAFPRLDRSLLPVGGGKDSIVAAEFLKKAGKPFHVATFGTSVIQEAVIRLLSAEKQILMKRTLDPQIMVLNKEPGVFNGHIPISVVYAFLGIFSSILYDYKYVIVSNEQSANYGNVPYLGEEINHQWSKSLEFEKMLQAYTVANLTPDVTYFSLLRPFTEYKITQLFVQYKQYFPVFSSCNRNFTIAGKTMQGDWCGECPKCAFVFAMLAAFLEKETVVGIFGKNLYADSTLLPLYEALQGIKDTKPFECVGEPLEVNVAMQKACATGTYEQDIVMQSFVKNVLPTMEKGDAAEVQLLASSSNHLLPSEFTGIITAV